MLVKKWFGILIMAFVGLQLGEQGIAGETFSTKFEPPFANQPKNQLYTAQWITYPWDKEFNQGENTGFFRQTITLPDEAIFSAIVEVPAYSCRLYVNGQLAAGEATTVCGPYWTHGVEISKYLKPGKNVLGLQASGNGYVFLQGDIVLVSGKVIHLASDQTWKYMKEAPADWSTIALDDSTWQPVKTRGAVNDYHRGRVPAHSGRLVLENPNGPKLFYVDTNEVVFRVRIPAGLAGQNPGVRYVIHNVTNGLAEGQGDVTKFEQQKDALVYLISGGKLARGVHVISLELMAGAEILEKRENEVFIVAGRIPQPEVAGDSLEQGMDLQLEDTINCYDTQDPHEFLEGGNGPSRIVKQKDLKYRELGAARGKWISKPGGGFGEKGWENSPGSFIAYKIKYKEPDQPYLIVLEYPDDRERSIQFQVNEIPANPEKAERNVWVYAKEGAGAVCGGIFPLSQQIRRLPILLFPSRSEGIVTVNTAADGKPAAAGRILVYRVGQIPALRLNYSGERWLGRYSERGYSFRRMLDGYRLEANFAPVHGPLEEKQSNWHTGYWSPANFAMWFRAIERFVQYLRFCGENMYIAGCYQYDEGNTPYSLPLLKSGRTARIEPDYRELLAAVFQENGLALWAGLEIVTHRSIKEAACAKRTDEEVAQGAETLWQVTAKGKQVKHGSAWSDLGNLYHPTVQTAVKEIAEELCEKLAPFASFKGFYSVDWPGWGFAPSKFGGYEDYTIKLFEKETGVSIPAQANDPGRFEQRASWLKEHPETAEKYINWRCNKMKEVKAQLVKKIQSYRNDLGFIFRCGDRSAWKNSDGDFNTFMKNTYIQDLDLYRGEKGLTLARMCIRGDESGKIGAYTNFAWRVAVSQMGHFDENPFTNPKYTEQWPWYHILAGACPTPAGEHTGEEFARIMGEWDPEIIAFAWLDDQIFLGHEQEIRNFAKGFLALPGVNLDRVQGPGIDPNVIVRSGRAGNQTVIFLANPGWWQNQVELELEVEGEAQIWDLTTGEEIKPTRKENKLRVTITLPPYGTRSLGISGAVPTLKGVSSRPDDSGRKGLSAMLERVKDIMAGDRVRQVLPDEDLSFMDSSVQKAEEALKGGQLAASWAYLAAPGFCQILNDKAKRIESIIPWLVIGPFPNSAEFIKKEDEGVAGVASDDAKDEYSQGFNEEFEAEKDVLAQGTPSRDKAYQGALNQELKWRKALTIQRDGHAYLDFLAYFKPQNWTVGYAWTRVYADKEQPAKLVTGSDDGLKVWVNGKLAQSVLKARGAKWGEDQADVQLKSGANWILVKVENRRGGFGFFLDLVDKDLKPLANLQYSIQ